MQDMRRVSFCGKCHTLVDTETVLLIYNYEGEVCKLYLLLEKRMSTYYYVDAAICQ